MSAPFWTPFKKIKYTAYPLCTADSLKINVVVLPWSQRWIPETLRKRKKDQFTHVYDTFTDLQQAILLLHLAEKDIDM